MTRNHRVDVIEHAIAVLDAYGLADLSMRRLAAELGVRPSALYHHVESKQVLLAAVADELLARGPRRARPEAWDAAVVVVCDDLRDAMLAYRDGAEVVATVHAFGLGARTPYDELLAVLGGSGLPAASADVGATTLLHFVFGHTADEQTHLQAGSAGAIDDAPRDGGSAFALGLELIVDGLRVRLAACAPLVEQARAPASAVVETPAARPPTSVTQVDDSSAELGEQHRGSQVDASAAQRGGGE